MRPIFKFNNDYVFKRPGQVVTTFLDDHQSVRFHNHDFYEMIVVTNGSGTHQIESLTFDIRKGDVFVIPPMIGHSYCGSENFEIRNILIKKDFIANNEADSKYIPGYLQLMEIEPFLRQNSAQPMFLHLHSSQLAELQQDTKYFERDGQFDKAEFTVLHNHTAWKIIYSLALALYEQINCKNEEPSVKYKLQILDTLEYIHLNFSQKITVEELAERVFLSRSTFLRNFRAVCGCSPIQYLNTYRIKKAIEMLEFSTKSKTEIAHSCGFYDLSYMERCIKSYRAEMQSK